MSSIKKITKNLEKKYWFYTALCPLVMIGEVVFETVIPFLMAFIIDNGIAACSSSSFPVSSVPTFQASPFTSSVRSSQVSQFVF